MKQIELSSFGIENLRIVEKDVPEPGRGEVLVRLGGASINHRDYQIVIGQFSPTQALPIVPLSDGAGEVVAVGGNVSRVATGDRVSPLFFPNWISGPAIGDERSVSSGLETPGTLREYGVYNENAVVRIADHLSDEEAACLPCAGLTAWTSLVVNSAIGEGDTVLLQGTGGVSLFALQIAKGLGASVIITSSSDEKLERAVALGADHTINYNTDADWGQTARHLTDGRGVDAVIEIGGEKTLPQSVAAIRREGHINVIGYLAGAGLGLSVFDLIMQNANLHGLSVGNRDQYEAMMRFVAEKEIRPVIHKSYAFEDAGAALGDIARGEHFGKLAIAI
jgi:NADPH:quinone reductase-like Zn-dependent oxidoreductase